MPSHLPGGSIRRRECSDLSTNPALPRPSLTGQDRVLALVSLVKEEEQSHLTGLLGKLKEIMGMLDAALGVRTLWLVFLSVHGSVYLPLRPGACSWISRSWCSPNKMMGSTPHLSSSSSLFSSFPLSSDLITASPHVALPGAL